MNEIIVSGSRGVGVRIDISEPVARLHLSILEQWFLYVSQAHFYCYAFLFSIVHLRQVPGMVDPVHRFPGAEYEATVYPLDPSKNPVPDEMKSWVPLGETIAYQFRGANDSMICGIAQFIVKALTDMDPSPFPEDPRAARARLAVRIDHWLEDNGGLKCS